MTRLLVVDDSADTRTSLKLLLERAGYRVALAENGAHALEVQRRQAADVLITDIFMPDTDGLETITRFRHDFPGVAIIAMSGGGARVRGAACLQTAAVAGADALLQKPFDIQALLEALRRVAPLNRRPGSPA